MLSYPIDIDLHYLPCRDSQSKKAFEENVELCRSSEDDIGKVGPFLLQLQHDIHETRQLSSMMGGNIDDIVTDRQNSSNDTI